MRRVGPAKLAAACSVGLGCRLLGLLLLAALCSPVREASAQNTATAPDKTCAAAAPPAAGTAAPAPGSAAPCQPPASESPQVWGVVGLRGFFTGLRPAPNGLNYDPLLGLYSSINFGLLPHKRLYLFLDNDFLVQRDSPRASGVSQRQFNAEYGAAWNYWDSLELRVYGYALNNINRGTSLTAPEGFKDGLGLENRYYFHYPDIYDVSRLGYVAIGYYPSQALVGNNGQSFKPGLFARGYLTESMPTRFVSYLYGGLGITAENGTTPRLLGGDFGIAARPIADRQNLELRIGDNFSDDLKAGLTRNYIYGAVRLLFAPESPPVPGAAAASPLALDWPRAWGSVGLPFYVGSSHMAANGVAFTPVFSVTSDLNLGILPDKKLYLFWDGNFWAQHSAPGITNSHQGGFDFSKREIDSNLGLAWNWFDAFELRGSVYALNNLNRGDSLADPFGGKQGVMIENRYNFPSPDPYDVGRSSFVGLGWIPTENLVGDNGASFRPGPYAHAYLARDLPIPWFRSYLYADLRLTAEHTGVPRLLDTDVGWAVRPIAHWQSLELRVGDDFSQDIVAAASRNLIYGAIRLNFGPRGAGSSGQ